jgi:hypothetical protein
MLPARRRRGIRDDGRLCAIYILGLSNGTILELDPRAATAGALALADEVLQLAAPPA